MKNLKRIIIIAAASLLSMSAGAKEKPTIILLHGAFQTSAGWAKVKTNLEGQGFKVVAVNLPGRDGDTTPIEQITADLYKSKVLDVVNAESSPVVLVGHSFGGIAITNVAEANPEKIKSLIYLSAYLPKNGESLQALAQTDKDSVLATPGNFQMSPDYKYASIKDEAKAAAFANDAKGEVQKAIVDSLIKEPLGPQATPVAITEANFGKVKKFYLMTTKDQCVSPALQARMVKSAKGVKVTKINAGHASYITQPEQVSKAIAAIAGK